MPCIKCNNGKWKYGEHGRCQFDTLAKCREAEQAIHARENPKKQKDMVTEKQCNCGCENCNKNAELAQR